MSDSLKAAPAWVAAAWVVLWVSICRSHFTKHSALIQTQRCWNIWSQEKVSSPCTSDKQRRLLEEGSAPWRPKLWPWLPLRPEKWQVGTTNDCWWVSPYVPLICFISPSLVLFVWSFTSEDDGWRALTATAPTAAVRQAHTTPTTRMMMLVVDIGQADVVIRIHRHNWNRPTTHH